MVEYRTQVGTFKKLEDVLEEMKKVSNPDGVLILEKSLIPRVKRIRKGAEQCELHNILGEYHEAFENALDYVGKELSATHDDAIHKVTLDLEDFWDQMRKFRKELLELLNESCGCKLKE
jgi:hypothetical protein